MNSIEIARANFKFYGADVWIVLIDGANEYTNTDFVKCIAWIKNRCNVDRVSIVTK